MWKKLEKCDLCVCVGDMLVFTVGQFDRKKSCVINMVTPGPWMRWHELAPKHDFLAKAF